MKLLLAFLVLAAAIAIAGCSTEKTGSIVKLQPNEFAQLIGNEDVFVIDVHTPEQEHVKGTNAFIPYDTLSENRDKLPSDKSKPIAVYCRSGSMSAEAAETLKGMGYKQVYELDGGTNAWKASGLEFGEIESADNKAVIFKSQTCGCCTNYASYADRKGLDVQTTDVQNMQQIKQKYGIPASMESCHTMIIEGYFVEGHIPIEAVEKLLSEKPDIKGIAMPGMPSASPGMPGSKAGPFIIYAVNGNGETSEFMRI